MSDETTHRLLLQIWDSVLFGVDLILEGQGLPYAREAEYERRRDEIGRRFVAMTEELFVPTAPDDLSDPDLS